MHAGADDADAAPFRGRSNVDVEHARVVWDAMDDAARRAFFERVEQDVDWAQDVDMLNFYIKQRANLGRMFNILLLLNGVFFVLFFL